MRVALWLWLWLSLGLVSCQPPAEGRPQWQVVVSTDTPVPQFADRLLVEVLRADGELACEGCRRVFAAGAPNVWPISFGVLPPPDETLRLRVRVRLHRASIVGHLGIPLSASQIDALALLPPLDGVTRVSMPLSMSCFGVAVSVTNGTSCAAASGAVGEIQELEVIESDDALLKPGSSPLAIEASCQGELPPGMVCVPGGLFMLGDPAVLVGDDKSSSLPERLVRLSPYALDRHEVSVGTVRQLLLSGSLSSSPKPRSSDPLLISGGCSYLGINDASNDALPISCVTRRLAAQICEIFGKRLPTAAQWEYAAGNRAAETPYPWGYDDNVCEHAQVSYGRFGAEWLEPTSCRTYPAGAYHPWGPVPVDQHIGDSTRLGILNFGGNVAEWVADDVARHDAPCMNPEAQVLQDPLCDDPSVPLAEVRGTSWDGFSFGARVARRGVFNRTANSPGVGFRCAVSM